MRPAAATLTPHELDIMKLVWERKSATVRDVYEALRARRRIAYTSVLTMMNVLERKGHLKKRAEGRLFVYQAARPRGQVMRAMVREFVERVFGGATEPLLVHLLEDRRLTRADLEALARRVREGPK
jgi:predicted transcriptional regulator